MGAQTERAGLVPSLSNQVLFAAQLISQLANYWARRKQLHCAVGEVCPSASDEVLGHTNTRKEEVERRGKMHAQVCTNNATDQGASVATQLLR